MYEEQLERSLVLPRDVLREGFTIYLADNIDRLEETLSGIKFKTLNFLYITLLFAILSFCLSFYQ